MLTDIQTLQGETSVRENKDTHTVTTGATDDSTAELALPSFSDCQTDPSGGGPKSKTRVLGMSDMW